MKPSTPVVLSHEDISQRARELWLREGSPSGRDVEFWLKAEAELMQQQQPQQSVPTSGGGDGDPASLRKIVVQEAPKRETAPGSGSRKPARAGKAR